MNGRTEKRQTLPKRVLEHTTLFVDICEYTMRFRLKFACEWTHIMNSKRRPRKKNDFLLVFRCECGRCVHHTHKTKTKKKNLTPKQQFYEKFNNLKEIGFSILYECASFRCYTQTIHYTYDVSRWAKKDFLCVLSSTIYLLHESLFHCCFRCFFFIYVGWMDEQWTNSPLAFKQTRTEIKCLTL